MRQGHNNSNNNNNNKRTRGRGRKPQSSANRTYDSNGPDVKIRGSAAHVAEKYVTLARDAQVSGDRIASENYLQHAEHYFRIIAAAQAQNPAPNAPQASGQSGQNVSQHAPGTGEQPTPVNGQGRGHGNSGNRDVTSEVSSGRRTDQAAQRNEAEPVKDGSTDANAASAEGADKNAGEVEAVEPSRPLRKPRTRRPRPKVTVADDEKAAGEVSEESCSPAAVSPPASAPPASAPTASAPKASAPKASPPKSGDEDLQPEINDDPVVAEAG